MEEVVIAGMSGKLPESENLEEFWANLIGGVDMVTADDRRWKAGTWAWGALLSLRGAPRALQALPGGGARRRPRTRKPGPSGQWAGDGAPACRTPRAGPLYRRARRAAGGQGRGRARGWAPPALRPRPRRAWPATASPRVCWNSSLPGSWSDSDFLTPNRGTAERFYLIRRM